jgi:hypothetical protein
MPTREGMMVEGEMLKRYTLRHGTFFGSYETAKEALAAFEHYDKVVRPVVDAERPLQHPRRGQRNNNRRPATCGKGGGLGRRYCATIWMRTARQSG